MSTIDEVLAAAEVVDAVCVIDGETRIISVPTEYKELGVESDEKVTRVKFQCPKIVGDNIDLTEYNLYINYRNAGNKLNSYLVEDVTVTGDTINFSWLLSRHVTESPGTINYIVCAKKSDDTGVINEWNTKVATGIVGIGLEATEEIEEQNIDAIEQILRSIVELENKVDSGGSGGYYAPSIDDKGNLTWAASKNDMPAVDGANIKGPQGKSGVYVGSGDMPDGYNVQIDPDGTPSGIIPPIPIVDSVDEMVDTSKQYILKSTGTIWAYKSATTEQEVTVRNDITSGYERGRLSSSGANAGDVSTHTLTPLIDLTKAEYQGKTIQIHLEGNRYVSESNETYIQFAIYKTDKSVLNGRSATCLDKAYSILPVLANVTTEINNTTSATITITMPAQYNGTEIGYMRFCGLGTVDGTVYITYKETQTVTSEQWVDTGIQYGGGLDEETAAKISELNNEGTDPTTIKLLAQPVLNFYNSSAYSDNDYTYSHLSKITYPCRADIPIPFTVKWNHNEDAMRTTVAVDTKAIGTVNAYTMRMYDATGLDNYPIYNLLPSKTYYYKVTHVLSDGSLVEAKSGSFTTSSEAWRLLYIDGTQNVRDLGGWTGLNGKKVKYGKIIRGAALSDSSSNSLIVTGKGKLALGELKIQAELNLGAIDNATSVAANCAYKKIGYTNYAIAITDETRRAQFKEVLEWIVSCLDGTLNVNGLYQVQRNIYMHCQGGCDRTATLSFQLLGLLGVSESDLAKEYELSSFSDVGFGRLRTTTKAVDTYDYVGMVEALKTYSGNTITDKFYDFATTGCGISADTITSFRNLMLE